MKSIIIANYKHEWVYEWVSESRHLKNKAIHELYDCIDKIEHINNLLH